MREQRKTLNRERADARAEARAAGKPAPPDGMRALLGMAVKGVGIARSQRAALSEMRAQTRAQGGSGRDDRDRRAILATGVQSTGSPSHGQADPSAALQAQGQGRTPRVLHATGFALGVMAMHGGGSQDSSQLALGLLLTPSTQAHDKETHVWL